MMLARMGKAMKPQGTFRFVKGALIAVSCVALSGCISLGGKVPPDLYRLTPDLTAPVGATASGPLSSAIVVLDPDADRSLDVLRVPVRVNASSLAYLKDAAWVEKPAREFRSLLAETIRARTGQLVVEGNDYAGTGKLVISGRLQEMGYDAGKQAVVVLFDAMQSGANGGGEVVTKRFEAQVNNVAPNSKAVGPALNEAANDVARQVADWIKGS